LKLADNTLYEERGQIEIIESEFDQQSGTIAIRARFPNPKGLLKHGSNGKVLFKVYLPNAVLVPQKSTFEIQDKIYTYVLAADSTLSLRNVLPRMRITGFYIVESGIKPEDYVVFEGVENAKDGEAVRAIPLSLREKLQQEKIQSQQ
jgi:membrane fusion protein (multidrug efflux system)